MEQRNISQAEWQVMRVLWRSRSTEIIARLRQTPHEAVATIKNTFESSQNQRIFYSYGKNRGCSTMMLVFESDHSESN